MEAPTVGEAPLRQPFQSYIPPPKTDRESPFRRNPLQSLNNRMLEARVDMFSSNMIISGPAADLGPREASRAGRKQLGGIQNPHPCGRAGAQHKALSIKDKISEWEGKKELPAAAPSRRADEQEDYLPSCMMERRSSGVARTRVAEAKNGTRPETEGPESERCRGAVKAGGQDAESRPDLDHPDGEPEPGVGRGREQRLCKPRFQNDHLSVLKQVKKLEQALKDGSAGLDPQLPGTCYSPHCLPQKAEEEPQLPENHRGGAEASRRGHHLDPEGREPTSEATEGFPTKPFINPLPKPRRTFKHAGEGDKDGHPGVGFRKEKRNLPPLPSLPPPPLPSSPPPASVNRRLWTGRQRPSADHRKSYEFEDLLQSSCENNRVDWYAQTKLGLTRTLSEENVYEDILDPPMKENPYEDIELHGRCLGKKCVLTFPGSPTSSIPDTPTKQSLSKPAFFRQNSERWNFKLLDARKLSRDGTGSPSKISPPSTPSSPDDTFFNLGDLQNGRKKKKIPKVMLATNFMFQ